MKRRVEKEVNLQPYFILVFQKEDSTSVQWKWKYKV